jgi:hypothetical protein
VWMDRSNRRRKVLWLSVALLLLFALGCGSLNDPPSASNTKTPSGWRVEYSPSMPADPTAGGPGIWYLDFPSDPNYPACAEQGDCKSLNYVTTSYSGPAAHSVSMTFQILTTGVPTFNYKLGADNTCATPATVRLFLERKDDDFSQEFYRWWANPMGYELQVTPGDVTLTVPLTPDQWSSVYGKTGDYDAAALAGFQDALRNLGNIGMTFGGGCFFGHGVNISGGTARFALMSYTIS